MSEWAAKRFWKDVSVEEVEGGFSVLLDARTVMTPGKRVLAVPSRRMADRIVAEWDAQDGKIDPLSMPWTRSANTALDKVGEHRAEIETHLIGYAGTDLLSYRAEKPDELIRRQAEGWDPVVDWVARCFDVELAVTRGVMPINQSPKALSRLSDAMTGMTDFQLTGFHDIVTLSGSYVLALSAVHRRAEPAEIWALSRIDEDWQIEQWGEDEAATDQAQAKRLAFLHATEFFYTA